MRKTFLIIGLIGALLCSSCALAEDGAVRIVFGSDGISAAETKDLTIDGNAVTIRGKGTYAFSGVLENGQIIVDAGGKDDVTLILNGVTVTNAAAPALMVENARMTTLRLATGTENALISGEAVDVLTASPDAAAEGGAIHARDSLRIEGDGSLTVGGYLNNGIHTSNHLTILGGAITVEAVHHGLKGKDSVLIEGGEISVTSGRDGVISNDDTGEGYGVVTIRGGSLTVNAAGDGIQAETLLDISGGVLNVTSGGGSADIEYDEPDDFGGWHGGWGRGPGFDFGEDTEDAASTKGLKSGAALTISGGTITVDAADDAVHSNGDVTVSGGKLTLSSGDDGIHADNALTVTDGVIVILASYEGMEANQILLAGGDIDIVSADDGLNAYGGNDMFGMGGRGGFGGRGGGPGFGGFGGPGGPNDAQNSSVPEELPLLRITGGSIHINAEGDGLDSNGSIIVEGGTVVVDGPFRSMNGAIDVGSESGGVCEVHGGTVLAIGAAGMADTFSSTSAQCSFSITMQGVSAGTEIVITDARGTELMRHTALKDCTSIVFTSPDLTLGETYTVTAGERSAQVTLTSVSTGGQNRQMMRRGW